MEGKRNQLEKEFVGMDLPVGSSTVLFVQTLGSEKDLFGSDQLMGAGPR